MQRCPADNTTNAKLWKPAEGSVTVLPFVCSDDGVRSPRTSPSSATRLAYRAPSASEPTPQSLESTGTPPGNSPTCSYCRGDALEGSYRLHDRHHCYAPARGQLAISTRYDRRIDGTWRPSFGESPNARPLSAVFVENRHHAVVFAASSSSWRAGVPRNAERELWLTVGPLVHP